MLAYAVIAQIQDHTNADLHWSLIPAAVAAKQGFLRTVARAFKIHREESHHKLSLLLLYICH